MAYIGKEPIVGNFQKCDAITVVNGQAAYTLQVSSTNVVPESANHMLVSLNGILQAPVTSFTVSGSRLTFASNLATGDVIDFVILLGNVLDLGTPSDGTVTNAKLASDVISGETDIGGAIADADLFLMDDGAGGTLRKTAASRIKTYVCAKVLKIEEQTNNTRAALSTSTSKVTILSGTYTNVQASSKVIINCLIPSIGNSAAAMNVGITWNGTDYDGVGSFAYIGSDSQTMMVVSKSFDCPASTGSINWVLFWESQNSQNSSPVKVINPNSTDDGRLAQCISTINFMEYTT